MQATTPAKRRKFPKGIISNYDQLTTKELTKRKFPKGIISNYDQLTTKELTKREFPKGIISNYDRYLAPIVRGAVNAVDWGLKNVIISQRNTKCTSTTKIT